MATYTLTFGDRAENHVGMQKLGDLAPNGFTTEELQSICDQMDAEYIDLGQVCPVDCEDAGVLIIRDGLNHFGVDPDELYDEQAAIDYDQQAYMYGRVVNKHARWNVCFGEWSQEPDYPNKKGRVVAFDDAPLTAQIRNKLPELFGEKAADLMCEGNCYYDITKCGIGFHGDAERRRVIGVRVGNTVPLHYQWYIKGNPIGDRVVLTLEHGDIYVMSEKAAGFDWKKKNVPTLRHAAGCSKYTS